MLLFEIAVSISYFVRQYVSQHYPTSTKTISMVCPIFRISTIMVLLTLIIVLSTVLLVLWNVVVSVFNCLYFLL